MPLVTSSTFSPPWYTRSGDLQTIVPRLLRKVSALPYLRERISTPDNDFLDLDWCRTGQKELVIISHGLEGSSQSPYVLGLGDVLIRSGYDVLAWNFRGCGGERSLDPRGYHSGKWDDLQQVVAHALALGTYRSIFLVGFSVGANITLLYLGNSGSAIPTQVSGAALFCAPVDLGACALRMGTIRNKIYMRWFLKLLRQKLVSQGILKPGTTEFKDFSTLKNFFDFDSKYTAPFFNYTDAEDYWRAASSKKVIGEVRVPTLLVNPTNDPMLSRECFPIEECKRSQFVFLETPQSGGHVGFFEGRMSGDYWSEKRVLDFFRENLAGHQEGVASAMPCSQG